MRTKLDENSPLTYFVSISTFFSDQLRSNESTYDISNLSYSRFVQAEARAEFAERSVQKLQKEVDRLEGKLSCLMNTNFIPLYLTTIHPNQPCSPILVALIHFLNVGWS